MAYKHISEIETITQINTTMGIEEFLLDRATKEGVKQGAQQEKRAFVTRLLAKTSFTSEQIADIVDVSVAFVKQVRKGKTPESGNSASENPTS